jgi:hypothetical protein
MTRSITFKWRLVPAILLAGLVALVSTGATAAAGTASGQPTLSIGGHTVSAVTVTTVREVGGETETLYTYPGGFSATVPVVQSAGAAVLPQLICEPGGPCGDWLSFEPPSWSYGGKNFSNYGTVGPKVENGVTGCIVASAIYAGSFFLPIAGEFSAWDALWACSAGGVIHILYPWT